jgi:hypothetical protein
LALELLLRGVIGGAAAVRPAGSRILVVHVT